MHIRLCSVESVKSNIQYLILNFLYEKASHVVDVRALFMLTRYFEESWMITCLENMIFTSLFFAFKNIPFRVCNI